MKGIPKQSERRQQRLFREKEKKTIITILRERREDTAFIKQLQDAILKMVMTKKALGN